MKGFEHGLEHIGAKTAGRFVPILDLVLIGHDIYEIINQAVEASDKLGELHERCKKSRLAFERTLAGLN